jgi:hypothetical protein
MQKDVAFGAHRSRSAFQTTDFSERTWLRKKCSVEVVADLSETDLTDGIVDVVEVSIALEADASAQLAECTALADESN